MKRVLTILIGVLASALAAWRHVRLRNEDCQDELAQARRELASLRARAMEAERQLALLSEQAAAPPTFGRGALAEGGVVSAAALVEDAAQAAAQLEAEADAQALDELTFETALPMAEVEVLQAGYEVAQAAEKPVEIDLAALAGRAGAVELLVDGEKPAEDDLTRLEGIGPTYVARLRQHGIVSFAQLAGSSEDALAAIIQAPAWRQPNFADWIAQARLAAAGDEAGLADLQAVLFSRRNDNLTLIDGLGQKYAAALQAGGVDSFAALAAATPEQIAALVSVAGLRSANFGAWIEEAARRAAGKRVSRRDRGAATP